MPAFWPRTSLIKVDWQPVLGRSVPGGHTAAAHLPLPGPPHKVPVESVAPEHFAQHRRHLPGHPGEPVVACPNNSDGIAIYPGNPGLSGRG